jgi:multidrug efflux pump subunit AcrB
VTRRDSHLYISVSSEFDGTDTSTLVILAEDAVKKEFSKDRLAGYGLSESVIKFDIGQEEENQDSFKTLLFAFPILLVAIYLLLSVQFRSLLQPVLIFMAIPFSLFGITAGLWLTDNAFSFFTMLGFFALIGLSIKNTILLTDYANQARRAGSNAIEAVAISLQERFRPLIATSLTAIVSLIPLYLSDPFWEGLTVTLMFGLLSSTFLVITVFPYYYLGGEYLRLRVRRRTFGLWLLLSGGLSAVFVLLGQPALIPLAILLASIGLPVFKRMRKA